MAFRILEYIKLNNRDRQRDSVQRTICAPRDVVVVGVILGETGGFYGTIQSMSIHDIGTWGWKSIKYSQIIFSEKKPHFGYIFLRWYYMQENLVKINFLWLPFTVRSTISTFQTSMYVFNWSSIFFKNGYILTVVFFEF